MSVAAVIQMTSSPDVAANLATARGLLERARAQGAVLAALPENFAIMGRKEADKVDGGRGRRRGPDPGVPWPLRARAGDVDRRRHDPDPSMRQSRDASLPRALVFDERGRCVARYDKIHLFDVDIPGREERYRESATVVPGAQPMVDDDTARPPRHGCLLRRALSRAVPRAAGAGRGGLQPAFGIHRTDGPCALGTAGAGTRRRESLLRAGARAKRHARQRPRNLWRFDDRRSVGPRRRTRRRGRPRPCSRRDRPHTAT